MTTVENGEPIDVQIFGDGLGDHIRQLGQQSNQEQLKGLLVCPLSAHLLDDEAHGGLKIRVDVEALYQRRVSRIIDCEH